MLIPLLIMALLAAMVSRAAKKFRVSSSIPLAVSAGLFLVFAVFSRGMIKIRNESELAGALVLGLLLYAAVAAALYGLAYALIKQAAGRKRAVAGTCSRCGAPVAEGAAFCQACGSSRERTPD